jgi:hypothetical protein
MTFTDLAIIALVGTSIYLLGVIVSKVDTHLEETQEERMDRLFKAMEARRRDWVASQPSHPARRHSDSARV